MIVAIIPARGGSKRIPRKNIKHFAGKPILAYSINAARRTKIFDKIIVSTDSDDIAAVARKYGAEVPFMRPIHLADDHATTAAVILQALDWFRESNITVNYVCCIYATAPLIRADDISSGLEILKKRGAASAFSVTTFPYPIFRALKRNQADRLEMIWPDNLTSRSQDLPEAYHDAGQFYWAQVDRFREHKRFIGDDAVPVVIPRYLVQDIDTTEDWLTAELMFKVLREMDPEYNNLY